jgi:tight adherence protein C
MSTASTSSTNFIAGGIEMYAVVFFSFVAVFLLTLAYMDMQRRRGDIKRRAVLERKKGLTATPADEDWLTNARSLRFQSLSMASSLLGDVERRAKEDPTETSKIKNELLKAGYFGENASLWYRGIRLGLTGGLAVIAFIVVSTYFPSMTFATQSSVTIVSAAIGFLLPSRFIAMRQSKIVEQCRNGFPDFVDLMVICSEAGLSPRAAIDRLSREIATTHPYLGANLYLSNLEIQAGSSLHDALFSLGRRTEVEQAITLATLLQQGEQLGASISESLRVYSEEMRDRRLIQAEERAHALPVKLVLPLGVFVFPVILIVVLLPVVIRMKNALAATNVGL